MDKPMENEVAPFEEGSYGHWIENEALDAKATRGRLLSSASLREEGGGGRIELWVCQDPEAFGAAQARYQVVRYDREGTAQHVWAQQLWSGSATDERLRRPLSALERERAEAALGLFMEATARKMERVAHHISGPEVERVPELGRVCMWCPCPRSPLPEPGLISLIETWIEEGPPGPRPAPLRVTEEGLRRAAAELVELEGEELAALKARLDPHAQLAYRIGAWTIALGPFLGGHAEPTFWEERVFVLREGEEAATVLMSDPWNAPICFLVDGDTGAFRGFSRWLGEALRRAGLDRTLLFHSLDEDEEEEEEEPAGPKEVPVSEWLRFGERWREQVEEQELIDWRLQRDIAVPGEVYWRSGIYGHSPEEKAAFAAGVETWHRFLREVIDPGFEGQIPRPKS